MNEIYLFIGVSSVICLLIFICRLYFDRISDGRIESELANIEKLGNQATGEVGKLDATVEECADRNREIQKISVRTVELADNARERINEATETATAAQSNNSESIRIIDEIEKILQAAKKS